LSKIRSVNCYVLNIEGAKQADNVWRNAFDKDVIPEVTFLIVKELPRMAKVEWEVVFEDTNFESSEDC